MSGPRVHIHVGRRTVATFDAWEENKHPRGEDGKFASGPYAGQGGNPGKEVAHWNLSKADFKKTSKSDAALATYTKGQATISVFTEGEHAGQWKSEYPGKQAKYGEGNESLKKIANGENIPIDKAPWKHEPTPGFAAQAKEEAAHVNKESAGLEPTEGSYALTQKLNGHAPAPTTKEKSAIKAYSGSAYMDINDCLRYKDDCGHNHVQPIENWLRKSKVKEPITVYRGVKGEYAKILASIATKGTKFVDRGFISTSTSGKFSQGWGGSGGFLMRIKVPAGAQAASIQHLSNHPTENEVLLQRGSALHVTGWDPKTRTMDVELDQSHFEQSEPVAEVVKQPKKTAKPKKTAPEKAKGPVHPAHEALIEYGFEHKDSSYTKTPSHLYTAGEGDDLVKVYTNPETGHWSVYQHNVLTDSDVGADTLVEHLDNLLPNDDHDGDESDDDYDEDGNLVGDDPAHEDETMGPDDDAETEAPPLTITPTYISQEDHDKLVSLGLKHDPYAWGPKQDVYGVMGSSTTVKINKKGQWNWSGGATSAIAKLKQTFPEQFASETPPADAPVPPKKPKAKSEDHYAGVSTDTLHKHAVKLGYVEKPSPNAGVRRMRVINFLHNHGKKNGMTPGEHATKVKELVKSGYYDDGTI